MNKLLTLDIPFSLITALVVKSLIMGINLPDALVVGCILAYKAVKELVAAKQSDKLTDSVADRVSSIEAKLNGLAMTRRM